MSLTSNNRLFEVGDTRTSDFWFNILSGFLCVLSAYVVPIFYYWQMQLSIDNITSNSQQSIILNEIIY